MSELLIGDFRVNLKRSEVIYQHHIITLEPKLLKVLLLLAETPGEIVSHQEFQQKVWPGVVVEANTLQRCIAKLRKIFNDDAKGQKFITTHPKLGYSLVAEVNWSQSLKKVNSSRIHLYRSWTIASLLFFISIYLSNTSTSSDKVSFSRISPVTSTDETEYRPSFSTDGRYIVFQRFVTSQESHLFAKDLLENKEYRLTEQTGIYGKPVWSPDGSKVAFPQLITSVKENKSTYCNSISSVSFLLAKGSPQTSHPLLPCSIENITSLAWLDKNSIAFISGDYFTSEVRSLNIGANQSTALYKQEGQFLHSLAFAPNSKKLAILQANTSFSGMLILLKFNKSLEVDKIQQVVMKPPKSLNYYLWGEISWHPNEDHLLVSNEHSLFKIHLGGKMVELPVPTYQTIYDPVYHPDGKRVAATLGIADFDINQVTWESGQKSSSKSEILYRSTLSEGAAKYQPNGEGIAFLSKRSGTHQLWFATKDELRLLTQLDQKERIQSFIWSNENDLLLVNVNNQLQFISTTGDRTPLNNSPIVLNVFQWLTSGNLLLKIAQGEQTNVVKFDINSGNSLVLYSGEAQWAQLYEDKKSHQSMLFVSDYNGLITKVTNDGKMHATELKIQPTRGKFFIESDKLLYTSQQDFAWFYDLTTSDTKKISELNFKIRKLDDIDFVNQRLLYKRYVSGKKEIVIIE
jgi:DNA-binding winged helix-turn-helix (wHTH) protein/dipeptidyl aminopeptidase/acylaminoacyl peptidase